jgi:CAAX protease family protein
VLAYTISWICWLPLLADRQGWASLAASSYLHLVGGLGPAVAALVVTAAVAGRSGLVDTARRTVAWRGRLRWIALAVLGRWWCSPLPFSSPRRWTASGRT